MDWELITRELGTLVEEGQILLKTNQPLIDFTTIFAGNLQICGTNKIINIPLGNSHDLNTIVCLLNLVLPKKLVVIGWNIKQLITYFRYQLPAALELKIASKVIDLKLWEAFVGVQLPEPTTLQQALKRLQPHWKNEKLQLIHKNIHLPLALEVMPTIETEGVQDTLLKHSVYPSYEIEGQINGRLCCSKAFPKCVNPQHLDKEKPYLRLRSPDEVFVYFDYRSMEARLLQHLSKDKQLGQIIEQGGDLYQGIWQLLTNSPCAEKERKTIKDSFLPVVYGMQTQGLAKRLGCSDNIATDLINAYRAKFSEAFAWVDAYQKMAGMNPVVEDCTGRLRVFKEKTLGVRNFIVQAPASIICLEKLIGLYRITGNKLVFSIHDGYVIRCNLLLDKPLVSNCKKLLEASSVLMPDLRLSVGCEIGFRLNNLKPITKKI